MAMTEDQLEPLLRLWDAQNEAYDLMVEYDSMPHHYGKNILYQAEGRIIDLIAIHPGINVTALSGILKKTPSACSQIVRKLREKGWVTQHRNSVNYRQNDLTLTEMGQEVYQAHQAFNADCQEETFRLLKEFTQEELEAHIAVQRKLNEAYRGDIKRSQQCLLSE